MLSLTRKPGEDLFYSISAEDLRLLAAQNKPLNFSMRCTYATGNKATFAMNFPRCIQVLRDNIASELKQVRVTQHELFAVEVVLDSETESVRWLNNLDVYPFSTSNEPLLFGLQSPAIKQAESIKDFVPEAIQAYKVPVRVTIERVES